jgi:hypothetical protein
MHYAEGGRVGGGAVAGAKLGDQPIHVVLYDNRREAERYLKSAKGRKILRELR